MINQESSTENIQGILDSTLFYFNDNKWFHYPLRTSQLTLPIIVEKTDNGYVVNKNSCTTQQHFINICLNTFNNEEDREEFKKLIDKVINELSI